MNLFTKRLGLVLAGVVGVGAIAALAIGASFALFNAQLTAPPQTFTAGTVSLYAPTSATCTTNVGNMEPGDTGTCTFTVQYGGTLPAYIGVEIASANAVGLINELELTINTHGVTLGTPVLIGNSGSGATSFTATLAYTLPLSAGNAYQDTKATLSATFVAVQCSNNGLLPSGALDPGTNETCQDPGPASWSQTPAPASTTPSDFYIESDSGTGVCDSAYGGSSPCFYPQNVMPGSDSTLTVTVFNGVNYYPDVTTTLTWPTADLTWVGNGDSSATCVAGTSGSNSTEACTYTDFSHSYKSDSFTFRVNSGVSGAVTVGISADAAASGGPTSTSEAILNVS
jgi:predicted ribosomally synthesized peptide with SipW-like signal peptide